MPPMNCFPDPGQSAASDEICGNFNIPCQLGPGITEILYATSGTITPFGTVSVFYNRGCDEALLVSVTDSANTIFTFSLTPGNTRSRTFDDIKSVAVTCRGLSNGVCIGAYCLSIHYNI